MELQILPSILAADFANLEQDCRKALTAGAKALHFDVMDGHFVDNISFGIPVLASLKKAMPEAVFDVHLMVTDPLKFIEPFAEAGAAWLTFHCEADSPPEKTIQAIHAAGMLAGISLKPSTPPQAVFPLLDKVDLVLVMSVEPGYGGQQFMPSAIEKIAILRKEATARDNHSLRIAVDGGINESNAALCATAGATAVVVGSELFSSDDYAAKIDALKNSPDKKD